MFRALLAAHTELSSSQPDLTSLSCTCAHPVGPGRVGAPGRAEHLRAHLAFLPKPLCAHPSDQAAAHTQAQSGHGRPRVTRTRAPRVRDGSIASPRTQHGSSDSSSHNRDNEKVLLMQFLCHGKSTREVLASATTRPTAALQSPWSSWQSRDCFHQKLLMNGSKYLCIQSISSVFCLRTA